MDAVKYKEYWENGLEFQGLDLKDPVYLDYHL